MDRSRYRKINENFRLLSSHSISMTNNNKHIDYIVLQYMDNINQLKYLENPLLKLKCNRYQQANSTTKQANKEPWSDSHFYIYCSTPRNIQVNCKIANLRSQNPCFWPHKQPNISAGKWLDPFTNLSSTFNRVLIRTAHQRSVALTKKKLKETK